MKLKDKIAFLTGAAGAGIGQATARLLAEEGATVIITDAHEERSRLVADEIKKEFNVETLGIGCDVTKRNAVEGAVLSTLETFHRIDILVNNAGTNRPAKVIDMSDEAWELVLNTTLRGAFYCCRAALPGMIKQNSGRIINIGSVAAFMGLEAGHAHYAAAKAGLAAFTRCLAMEVASHYITINTVAPSFIYNEFIPRLYPEEEIDRMQNLIPYPRKGTPEDIAKTVLFLATEGEYITGQTLCVTGGSWMH